MGMCGETRRPRRQRRWTSLTCMDSSFQLLPRAASTAGVGGDGLTLDALRPRSDAGRARRSGGEEDAAWPRVIRWGNRLRGAAMREAAGLRLHQRPAHGRKTQLAQGAERHGEAARHEAASLLGTADRRMSKVRPSCQSAMPQGMRSRSKRQTHFDRLMEDETQCALRPWRPTDEAINPKRRTIAQRKERSTPTARRVSSGRRAYHSNRRTGPRTKDQRQLRRLCPRCLRRTNVNSASAAFPRGRPGESESSSGRTRATGITHPGFLWSETLEKA